MKSDQRIFQKALKKPEVSPSGPEDFFLFTYTKTDVVSSEEEIKTIDRWRKEKHLKEDSS